MSPKKEIPRSPLHSFVRFFVNLPWGKKRLPRTWKSVWQVLLMSWAAEATELKALHGGKDRACQGLKSGPGQAQQQSPNKKGCDVTRKRGVGMGALIRGGESL